MENSEFQIILFYKYVYIADPNELMHEQQRLQKSLFLTGRTLIAHEGINATLEGTRENIEQYLSHLFADPRFYMTHIKKSPGNGNAFPKCMVKVKNEIVFLGLGVCDINPNKITGKHLPAEELHNWMDSPKEFYIIDMRNAYEQEVGHFKNSVMPPMDNFRDLPKFLKSLEHLKNKTVVTVCTGGVRCEKASGYLLANGFTDVYQLQGGIVSYLEKYPNENFLGKLYVFDNRIHIGYFSDDPKHIVVGECVICENPCERFTNCVVDYCHRQCIACLQCQEKKGSDFVCTGSCREATREGDEKV